MFQRRLPAFLSALFSLIFFDAGAQDMAYRFELPSRKVTSITQDKAGWIWIGTNNGLCRYNGNGFLVFTSSSDTGGLENDEISCLFTDGNGTIWFGNECGIGHSVRGQFVAPDTPLYNQVHAFAAVDTSGVIMAERHSILKMSSDFQILGRFITPHLLNPEMTAIPSKKEVWLYNFDSVTQQGEIIILDANLKEIRRIQAVRPADKLVCNPSTNTLWTFGPEGLASYNLQSYSAQPLPPSLSEITNKILFINSFDGHDLLLGTEEGLFRYDSFSNSVVEMDRSMPLKRGNEYVSFVDRDLNVWLYSENDGLCFTPSVTFRAAVQEISDILPSAKIRELFPDGDSGLWILSEKGADRYSLLSRKLSHHITGSFKDMSVDTEGHLWLTGFDRTLSRYSIEDGRLARDFTTSVREVPRSLASDGQGKAWLAYSSKVQTVSEDGVSQSLDLKEGTRILRICYSPQSKKVFMISSEGIYALSSEADGIKRDALLQSVRFPTCIEESGDGALWIGTINEGLLRYNPSSGEIRRWNALSGLIDNHVKFLQKDNDGNIWLITARSIARFDVKKNSFNYVQKKQLTENRDIYSACLAPDACLYCCGDGGLLRVRPSEIAESTVKADEIPIYLDYLKVNGKRRSDLRPGVPLILSYKEDMLNLGFSGLKYGYGPFLTYQYKLDGHDTGWIPAYSSNDISYSNLPAGKYTFRARVRNLNGQWSAKELSVPIEIKPALWATWWAKLIYILIFSGLVIYGFRLLIKWQLREERLSLTERDARLQQDHIDFLVNVSHELRTPLTLISAPLKQLEHSRDLSAQDRALVGTIEKSAGKLEKLAEQIMNAGKSSLRIESPLCVRDGSLISAVRAIADNFRFIALDKELQLELSADDSLPDGYFDAEKLERILNNLISNAVKYTPTGGEPIRIRVAADPDLKGLLLAHVSVEDSGPGIPEEKRADLFERFNRLDADHFSPEIKGAGVGLNYAQYLAIAHHGAITFSDHHPHGSIFTFTFPYSREGYTEGEIGAHHDVDLFEGNLPEDAIPSEQSEGRILLVEDNDDVRTYLRQLLSAHYQVTTAVDGLDAWDRLQAGAVPDLVVSDVIMPRKDGFELCRDIKQSTDYTMLPVLLLTAKSDLDNHVRGLDCGADAYIPKPFDPFLLQRQIENLIRGRRVMQQKIASLTSSTIPSATDSQPEAGQASAGDALSEYDRKFLERLYKSIDDHLDEQDFNVNQLSGELCMSYSRVYVKIKMLTGETPLALLNTYRMNMAMERLKSGKYSVGEVSEMVGASSLANFSRSFKRQFGIPPSQVNPSTE